MSPSRKGPVPSRIPRTIRPRYLPEADSGSWLRPTKLPFTVPERRQIEKRLAGLIEPASRNSMIRSVTAAAGHLSRVVGVEHQEDLTAQLLLQAASLKGVLMDEALAACYLPPGWSPGPTQEERAQDALARWYIAWLAASRRDE